MEDVAAPDHRFDALRAIVDEPLDTPCLVVDADRVDANVRRMQAALGARGVALRPHAKTHKSVPVARLQLEAGATGITVGTLGEAEVFAAAGIDDLFLAYPLWASPLKGRRLVQLLDAHPSLRLRIGVESADGAIALARALGPVRHRVEVLVEIESGERRTGTEPGKAGIVARAAAGAGLAVIGSFTHGGHSYRIPGAADEAADDEVRSLAAAARSLEAEGFDPGVRSAGSTPTAVRSARDGVTEERPGTYVFGDRQQVELGGCEPDGVALVVAATVVRSSGDRAVLDSGAKSLGRDRKPWMRGHGAIASLPGAEIVDLFDYHAVVDLRGASDRPRVGEQVIVVPNHVCSVVNLFEALTVVRGGAVVDRWPVDARARSS